MVAELPTLRVRAGRLHQGEVHRRGAEIRLRWPAPIPMLAVAARTIGDIQNAPALDGPDRHRLRVRHDQPGTRERRIKIRQVLRRSLLIVFDQIDFELPLLIGPLQPVLAAEALNVGDQVGAVRSPDVAEGRHERLRARVARVLKMRPVPVVRVIACLTHQVRPITRRADQMGGVIGIIARLRGQAAALAPVHRPRVLRMAVDTAVLDVDFTSL